MPDVMPCQGSLWHPDCVAGRHFCSSFFWQMVACDGRCDGRCYGRLRLLQAAAAAAAAIVPADDWWRLEYIPWAVEAMGAMKANRDPGRPPAPPPPKAQAADPAPKTKGVRHTTDWGKAIVIIV